MQAAGSGGWGIRKKKKKAKEKCGKLKVGGIMPFRNLFKDNNFKDNNFLRVWLLIFADRLVQVKKQGFVERSFMYDIGMMDTSLSKPRGLFIALEWILMYANKKIF